MNFENWWNETGSGIRQRFGEDLAEFAEGISRKAWQAAIDSTTQPEFNFESKPDPAAQPHKEKPINCNNASSATPAWIHFDREALKNGFAYVADIVPVLERLRETPEGATCPCCKQYVKAYRRKIHSQMAHCLIRFWRRWQGTFAAVEGVYKSFPAFAREAKFTAAQSGDFAKLQLWGLIEPETGTRPDGSGRTGFWRVTNYGKAFVKGGADAHEFCLVYNGQKQGFGGKRVSIQDCLGSKFDYAELMGGGNV